MGTEPDSFIRRCWYVVAWSSEVADQPLAMRVGEDPVVLFRRPSGEVVALEDRCPHRMAPLSMGRVEGDSIRCMYHGAQFGPDGHCLGVPGQTVVPASFVVRRYAVQERDGWIWIWLGSSETADLALLPTSELARPEWRSRTSRLDYDAHYELLNDNLCDFSHVAYVHEKTFGMVGGSDWAQTKPTITPIDRGVRVSRWIEDSPSLPFLDAAIRSIDLWSCYEYLLPGILLMHGSVWPAGSAQRWNHAAPPPDAEPLHATYNAQAVTPMGPHRSRYFYGVAVRTVEPAELLEPVFALTAAAFLEDKAIIEAQQKMILQSPGIPLRGTTHDQAVMRMRRLVQGALSD